MNQDGFERRVLEIWVRSRVALTAAHVQHLTGAPRDKVKRWLDAMTAAGALDLDVDDEGEMTWKVRGAERPAHGPATIAELEKLERLSAEVGGASRALAGVARATSLAARPGGDHKSVVASGVLSLFFGPLGWLYAAPLREAVPGAIAFGVAASFLPHFLLAPLLGVAAPLSGLAGVYYAWRHNQTGERTGLFSDPKGH
ncbi:MAG TPA: hypothetical protein VHL80_07695 [Polyangia bacterium]|nr:hypothetical protein [Polyangia bacterium]